MSKFSTATIMKGPKGEAGASGVSGTGDMLLPGRLRPYNLIYAGLVFKVWLNPDTFALIEDPTNVTGDELEFIKVINQEEWESIRGAWADAWQKQKAYRAFELGDFGDE